MKYLKYIILIVVFIIIVIIGILLKILNGDKPHVYEGPVEEPQYSIELNRIVSDVAIKNYYYDVKNIVEKYYSYLADLNKTEDDIVAYPIYDEESVQNNIEQENENNISFTEMIEEEKEITKNAIYNLLSKEYIEKNGITVDNIQEKLGNYKDVVIMIDNMYTVDASENVKVYFAYGKVIEVENKKKTEFGMMISIDSINMTYEIYPSGYEYNVEKGKELIIDLNEIENREYNKYRFKVTDNETYCKDLVSDYKNRLMYDLENAYNMLDEQYSKAKFDNFAEFEKYVQNNYNKLITINIKKYGKDPTEDYIQYVFEDRQGKEYIFKEKTTMKYSVILDTYTLNLPEFIQKYENSNTKEKVILNLNKFMMAINDKDYKYAYNTLADSFKQNNFPTLESFETYAKQNFFDNNKFEYGNYDSEGETYYTYAVTISDGNGQDTKTISKTFIIQLKEGTDFVLSFNK